MVRNQDPFSVEITPDLILRAYRAGIFPMAEDAQDEDLFWVSPEERGIIPLDGFRVSKSFRKTLKTHPYIVTVDQDFDAVIDACATPAPGRTETWINNTIRGVYGELFRRGDAHTVEVRDGEELVGGLYGLAIGGAFFGESMFHHRRDTSKIALAHLVERLNAGGYVLLDTQFITPHLASLGAIEIPRSAYEDRLAHALAVEADWHAWTANPNDERTATSILTGSP
ncbi:leucyl/phenylalanyl-tRNA--protein transferase [Devosia pacifica]|uniref:Leucyl/phenylalanyl-tRNA--protein transferase n=1 Tax=Devosia pacifica TaxID=1335967 RepID=A0A918VNA9_9HYPH|nr:leucyl/phenylalanyl-tRNA--protein transferase [Devosia pacifica]GHA12125.1 leucyl/phenylalanyl-tRNA--protein transferase [Devosia pacifica]